MSSISLYTFIIFCYLFISLRLMSIQRLIKISAYSNSSLRNDQAMFSNKAASDSVVNVSINRQIYCIVTLTMTLTDILNSSYLNIQSIAMMIGSHDIRIFYQIRFIRLRSKCYIIKFCFSNFVMPDDNLFQLRGIKPFFLVLQISVPDDISPLKRNVSKSQTV